jgi:hypothetical protein
VQKPTVPNSIQAPAGEELVFMARATGFQIYVCRPDANGKPAWTLKAPDADYSSSRQCAKGISLTVSGNPLGEIALSVSER